MQFDQLKRRDITLFGGAAANRIGRVPQGDDDVGVKLPTRGVTCGESYDVSYQ
jgi:hypothetical protein